MGMHETENDFFSEYLGSVVPPRPLPWLDVEKALFLYCNRDPGYDSGIALDYRPGLDYPRVIASDWNSSSTGVVYREIAESFQAFVVMLQGA